MTDAAAGRWSVAMQASSLAYGLTVALVILLQFGPAIGLAGFITTGDVQWTLIGVLRDVLVLSLLLHALFSRVSRHGAAVLPVSGRWAVVLVACYVLLSLFSDSAPNIVALNLRRLILVPMLFIAILLTPWSSAQVDGLFRLVVWTSGLVALLGIAERLAPESLWTEFLRVEEFTAANSADRFGSIGFYEGGRFFTWDFEPWLGQPVRRLVSTYIEPTTLAAGMAAALCVALARRARGHSADALVLLLLTAGALTLSKAFLIFLLVLLVWRAFGWPHPGSVGSMTLLATTAGIFTVSLGYSESSFAHVDGLVEALQVLADGHWLGSGIGAAGNYTDQANDTGGESGLGNTIAQAGLMGLLPLLWIHYLARDLMRASAARRDTGGVWLGMWLMFWLVSFLYSASSLGVGGNALGFMALALYLHPASAPMRRRAAQRRPGP